MTDDRQDRSDRFKKPLVERGNPHGGRGRRAARDIREQFETQSGHPLGRGGGHAGTADGSANAGNALASRHASDATGVQHARKGQAESPVELTLNQPEKKKRRGGR